MLKSWSIENFKSIVDSGKLQLAPVTVLAGLNSSGKSSFLQSILMISQTLGSRVLERPLLPNGAIIQLGTFDDILNENTNSRSLKISFELTFEEEEIALLSKQLSSIRYGKTKIKYIRIAANFRGFHEKGVSNSAIESSRVIVDDVSIKVASEFQRGSPVDGKETLFLEPDLENLVFDIRNTSREELNQFLRNVDSSYLRLIASTEDKVCYLGKLHTKDKNDAIDIQDEYFVSLSHFLPARLLRRFKIKIKQAQRLRQALRFFFDYSETSLLEAFSDIFTPEMLVSDNLRASIHKICIEKKISEQFAGQDMNDLQRWYREKKLRKQSPGRTSFEIRVKEAIVQDLIEHHSEKDINHSGEAEGLEPSNDTVYEENLERANEKAVQFFTSKIRYLGPLRADPQAVQRFAPSSELDEVGAKGEYAAAVYDANQNARIEWYNPSSEQVEQGTLKSALNNWADYLGIANQIKIEEAGQSGVSWQVVHKEGFKPRPLASVGVGVSQILPILVMGLLAPKHTLLLIEQPELHLHPRVQARLGDFFMGLAKCGKQCLIETHSENLVSQLRYHIVQAGGQDKSDCMIYFVDQDETGASRFDPVEISPNGNILNWPDGFFDETMLQEDRITAASLKKRAGNAKK